MTISGFKLKHKAIQMQTTWYWNRNRPMEQSRRTRNNPKQVQPLIFDKDPLHTSEINIASLRNDAVKTESGSLFLILYKNQVKMQQSPLMWTLKI
jgi:hypothetical protein